jgi:hypothetical protein
LGGEGSANLDDVRDHFRDSKADIMECYDNQIKAGNLAKGVVLIDFMIWTDGCAAEVQARVKEKGLDRTARCIENIIKGFCGDEPDGGPVKLRAPMLFEPEPSKRSGRRRR